MKTIYDCFFERGKEYYEIFKNETFIKETTDLKDLFIKVFKSGNKVLLCGNGGSAADCQHIAGEFVGRLTKERTAWPVVALCSDISVITCLGNDYTFEKVFNRQIEALGEKGDLLIALSTSGNSKNVLNAISEAKKQEIFTCLISNITGGKGGREADYTLKIPSHNTQVVQEVTMALFHMLCEVIEGEYY